MLNALANLIHLRSEEKQITPKTNDIPVVRIDPNKKQVKELIEKPTKNHQ